MMIIVQSIGVFMLLTFLVYVLSIAIPFLRLKPKGAGVAGDFEWHFFIPCRDEASVIENTITRLRSTFPHSHIWVIDDDSEDETAFIVQQQALRSKLIHLVKRKLPEARTGKGNALNAAYHELLNRFGEKIDAEKLIICVLDADGELAENALSQAASRRIFGDPRVGAAQTTVFMKNRNARHPLGTGKPLGNLLARTLVRMQDIEFRTTIAAMQSLREATGSVGLGGNGQFARLSVLQLIAAETGEPWHGALLEDYELGVHVLLAGYETRHIFETHVAQEGLTSPQRFVTQRTRWAQGNIQCIKYLPKIVSSMHFTNAGVVESAYYLFLPFIQIVGIGVWLTLGATLITGWTNERTTFSQDGMLWYLLSIAVFGILPFAIWGPIYKIKCEPDAKWWHAVGWGICLWLYTYALYVYLLRAFYRVLTGRNGWLKTRRNAEVSIVGPTAKDT